MATPAQLKQIKQTDLDLMAGFIRSKVSDKMNAPTGILQLCLIYYLIFEEWDETKKGSHLEIPNSLRTICECSCSGYQTILGSKLCSKGIHQWTIQLLKVKQPFATNWSNVVGIVDTSLLNKNTDYDGYLNHRKDTIYFFIGWLRASNGQRIYKRHGAQFQAYGAPFKTAKDIIDIYLDLNKGTLGFGINGKDYGIAYSVDTTREYKLFVTMSGKGTSFEILSYSYE